ncbi:hypothetical protein ACFL14_01490 [Patescibacteria group bacterium]
MNSFFAAVEQQVQPIYRDKPLGVTPYTGDSGCIIAASRAAKKIGIRTGNRVGQAKSIYPFVKIIEARPALYMIYHKEIKKVLENFSPHFVPLSIDEFAVELSPNEQNFWTAYKLAKNIKTAIREEVGDYLTCSVGVGPNRFLSKMAAESKKPDGLVVLRLADLYDFYSKLHLQDMTGINFRMDKQLRNLNINTPLDLYNLSLVDTQRILKHWGRMWYFRMRGYEVDNIQSNTQTIGHSHVLAPEFRNKKGALGVINKLLEKTSYRLRKHKYLAGGVSVVIRFSGGCSFVNTKKVCRFSDDFSFRSLAMSMIESCPWSKNPMFVAISVFNLSSQKHEQVSIFEQVKKSKKASEVLDKLNDKYGAKTICNASIYKAIDSAPDRIPLGNVRYDIKHT